ncbi:hypothetical protein NXW37_27965 [Bacteroides thetaiotaomicron]|nr:hypothetical protein [Bacteroides thetaiotaomicron]
MGGFIPGKESSVLTDGLCYQPASGQWQVLRAPLTTEGQPLTLTGGASVSYGDTLVICAGGVNRDIFEDAISGRYKKFVNPNISYNLWNGIILMISCWRMTYGWVNGYGLVHHLRCWLGQVPRWSYLGKLCFILGENLNLEYVLPISAVYLFKNSCRDENRKEITVLF